MLERGHSRSPVWRMFRVRDCDLPDARVGQHQETAREVDARIFPRPHHDSSRGVLVEAPGHGQVRGFELLRVVDVGGEEEVERGAVLDLREEVARRAIDGRDRMTRFTLELLRRGGNTV